MSGIPREVVLWLNSLNLTYQVKNPKRDLANGFVVAEIYSRYINNERLDMNCFEAQNSLKARENNWEYLQKIVNRFQYPLQKSEYDGIIHYAEGAAMYFLLKLYKEMTEKDAMPSKVIDDSEPYYARTTITAKMRDHQLARIPDETTMKRTALHIIDNHNTIIREEKVIPGRLTKLQMGASRMLKADQTISTQKGFKGAKKAELTLGTLLPGDVKEVKVKSGGYGLGLKKKSGSTSRRANITGGGIEEEDEEGAVNIHSILNEIVGQELKDEKNFGRLHPEHKNIRAHTENLAEYFSHKLPVFEEEEDKEGSKNIVLKIFEEMNERADEIITTIVKAFSEFPKFTEFCVHCLRDMPPFRSASFPILKSTLIHIGNGLLNMDPQICELFFTEYFLPGIASLFKDSQHKTNELLPIIMSYIPNSTNAHFRVIKVLGKLLRNSDLLIYCLSKLLFYENTMNDDLYNLYFDNAVIGLRAISPITRTKSISILAILSKTNFRKILPLLDLLLILSKEYCWELRAQMIILCSNILVHMNEAEEELAREIEEEDKEVRGIDIPAGQSADIKERDTLDLDRQDEDSKDKSGIMLEALGSQPGEVVSASKFELEVKLIFQIMDYTFNLHSPKPTQKIGLIYLAKVLNYYFDYTKIYLDILLHISDNIRGSVLDVNPLPGTQQEVYVGGAYSEKYITFGAPIEWNSLYLALHLQNYIKENNLDALEQVHIDVFEASLFQEFGPQDIEAWLGIFQNLKNYFFIALCDRDLSLSSIEILKKFFCEPKMQSFVLQNTKEVFIRTLSLLYQPDVDVECKENMKEFLEFLHDYEESNQELREFVYVVIKNFADQSREAYQKCNLIQLMNQIVAVKRGNIYDEEEEGGESTKHSSSFAHNTQGGGQSHS